MLHRVYEISDIAAADGSLALTQELSLGLKNNVEALRLACAYLLNPYESKPNNNQWVSLIFHEHSKSASILK